MIITSENPSPRKVSHQQTSPPPPGGLSPPPPPYISHQSSTQYVVAAIEQPPESAGRRFIKAFLVANLIWLLTGAFVSSCFDLFGVIRPVSA